MTKDEHMSLVSEESSSYPDNDPGLELALSLGGGGGTNKLGLRSEQTRRILTSSSKNLQSQSSLSSSSSSSPSTYFAKPADFSLSPNAAACNQVVGWPPIRAYRMNNMVNQVKFPSNDESEASVEKCKSKNGDMDINCSEGDKNYIVKEERQIKKSNFVKVNKDGNGIGRKVDLNAFNCYETFAQTVEKMFFGTGATSRSSRLLDGSSDFVLTYEDKDGDWMLVGDVPWAMFINSVKRLRIMRTAEANGLGCKFQISNVRPNLPI